MRHQILFQAFLTLTALSFVAKDCSANLIITGVVDGTQSGGNPKAMEILATAAVPDLSNFYIVRDTNGTSGGPFTVSSWIQLPSVSLAAGDFYYIYGTSATETYLESEGFGDTDSGTALLDGVLNHNGDDIMALATANDGTGVIDAFGLLGQGDTNFAENSIAYRQANTPANPTGVMDAGNFDLTNYSDSSFTNTFGTYQFAVIPEPSAFLLGSVLCAMIAGKRYR